MPTVKVSFFVGISSIYLCMAFEEAACLMLIMVMDGRLVFSLPSFCSRGEGFEDDFLENSDLSVLVRTVF
jgi:hypothetical protein